MPEHAPQSENQRDLYHEIKDNYIVMTQERWDQARDYRTKHGEWPADYEGWDYLIQDTIDCIQYLLPNDETWFHIIAVSHEHSLAKETGFCEMNDFYPFKFQGREYPSDYAQVVHNDQLKCRFEVE